MGTRHFSEGVESMNLTMHEYQNAARSTAHYPREVHGVKTVGLFYTCLGLSGEAGEVADKVKKIIRDDNIEGNPENIDDERAEQIADELGDVLWYLANTAYELGFSLNEIADRNISKLADRNERDVIRGSGDYR